MDTARRVVKILSRCHPTHRQGSRQLILLAIAVFVWLGRPASALAAPHALSIRNVTVTNVADSSFTVSWVTDQPLPGSGSILYGTTPSDVSIAMVEVTPVGGARGDVHVVNLRNLTASTTFYLSVVNAGVPDTNNGNYYRVATGPSLQTTSTNRQVSGVVMQSDGRTPAAGVVVIARILDNAGLNGTSGPVTSAPLSAVTNSNGSWSLTLSPRSADNTSNFNFATTGPDFLLVSVEGGSLGVVSPSQSFPIALDSTGKMGGLSLTLGPGAIPTDTPLPATATSTPTPTPSVLPTATTAATSTVLQAPIATQPRAEPGAQPATPTAEIHAVPTVAPVSTAVQPPLELTTGPIPVVTTPSSSGAFPTAATLPVRPTVVVPAPSQPSPAPPQVMTPTTSGQLAQRPRRPATTAELNPTVTGPSTPTPGAPSANGMTSANPDDPLQHIRLVLIGALGLIGGGLVLSVLGFVDQRRDG